MHANAVQQQQRPSSFQGRPQPASATSERPLTRSVSDLSQLPPLHTDRIADRSAAAAADSAGLAVVSQSKYARSPSSLPRVLLSPAPPAPLRRLPSAPVTLSTAASSLTPERGAAMRNALSALHHQQQQQRQLLSASSSTSPALSSTSSPASPSFQLTPPSSSASLLPAIRASVPETAHRECEQVEDSTPLLSSAPPSPVGHRSLPGSSGSMKSSILAACSPLSSAFLPLSSAAFFTSSPVAQTRKLSISFPLKSSLSSCSSPWRAVRAVCLLLVCCLLLTWLLMPRIILFATTGSVLYHDYDYYSAANAVRRLYPHYYAADGQYTSDAKRLLALHACPPPSNTTNPMRRHGRSQTATAALAPSSALSPSSSSAPPALVHLHVVVSEPHWTLFPFLWDSLLVNDTEADPWLTPTASVCTTANRCHRCSNDSSGRCDKLLPALGLRVTLLDFPIPVSVLPSVSTLLVVGEYMEMPMFAYLRRPDVSPHVRPDLQLASLMLTGEECDALVTDWSSMQRLVDDRLAFSMQPYGDCHLDPQYHDLRETSLPSQLPISVHESFVYWPLGPSVEHGFPSRLPEREREGVDLEERALLLNLMVSITQEKSTRMQAWMVARDLCSRLPPSRCYLHNNDFVYKVVTAIDGFTSLSLHSLPVFANPTETEYLPLLLNSTFTLCPSGKNPEQYRIWEALMAGSIPIIERPHFPSKPELNPAYGATMRCTDSDVHRVLRKYHAPVLYLEDWRQLPQLISRLSSSDIVKLRRELRLWFRELKRQLRREIVERVRWLHGIE